MLRTPTHRFANRCFCHGLLATDEDRKLLGAYSDQRTAAATICQEAAYLVGLEVGRRALGQPPTPQHTTPGGPSVEDVMLKTIATLLP